MWSALIHKAEEKMVGIRLHVTTGTGKAGCTLGGTTYTAVPVYIPGTIVQLYSEIPMSTYSCVCTHMYLT